ncbi:putative cupredoxin [Tanacetum coccineum]
MVSSFTFLVVVTTVAPKEYQVGGVVDWRLPDAKETEFYNVWPYRRLFHIRDSLRFHFTYSVVIVEKSEFFCIDSDGTAKHRNLRFEPSDPNNFVVRVFGGVSDY